MRFGRWRHSQFDVYAVQHLRNNIAPGFLPGKGEVMASQATSSADAKVIERAGLDQLIRILLADGFQVIGPRTVDGAIALEPVEGTDDLPAGISDDQDGGRYRLVEGPGDALFAYGPGPHSWKRYLFPTRERLWRARREGTGFVIDEEAEESVRYAFLGVRSCDLSAMAIQDRVFDNGAFSEPGYGRRRAGAFIIAVECARAGGTCFCTSMGTGPAADEGFDVALTEFANGESVAYVARAGSEEGADVLQRLDGRAAKSSDVQNARTAVEGAAASTGREMVADAADVLARNLESRQWDQVAKRCLTCGNCTLVCPTCFCSTVEDVTDLTGTEAERWRLWDSCFSMEFSYIHGGSIRREGAARYRQWITHKLSSWHQQFETSGCVGCGRCITWCPVGIDITEEARALRDSEGGH